MNTNTEEIEVQREHRIPHRVEEIRVGNHSIIVRIFTDERKDNSPLEIVVDMITHAMTITSPPARESGAVIVPILIKTLSRLFKKRGGS
jgi:hypothetical protein